MKKDNAKMLIHIKLDNNFINIIKENMEDEIDIASQKWGVKLNTDDKDNIYYHSMNQLQRKVSENARTQWDLSNDLTIKVNSHKPENIEITLPDEKTKNLKTQLIYTRDGWEIDQEMAIDAVNIGDFFDHIQERILFWARTAVFYGVGSFSQ